jgi:hypothetical protein
VGMSTRDAYGIVILLAFRSFVEPDSSMAEWWVPHRNEISASAETCQTGMLV